MFARIQERILNCKLYKFTKHKTRLTLEYGLIASVIVLGAGVFTLWLNKQEVEERLQSVSGRLEFVETRNARNETYIRKLKQQQVEDAILIQNLITDYEPVFGSYIDIQGRLDALELTTQELDEYLNSSVPLELHCVISNTCNEDD